MGDQKIINLLEYTTNQLSKFRTKNLVEINGDAHGFHSAQSQIKFKIQCHSYVYVITVIHAYL